MVKRRVVSLFLWLGLIACISACQRQDALRLVSTTKSGVSYGVHVDAGYAYITNNDGVIIFDVQEPRRPREVGQIHTGFTKGVLVKNGWAYIASESGLVIADVSNTTSPQLMGTYESEGAVNFVHIEDDYVYLASSKGLEIVDIKDPNTPVQLSYLTVGEAWGMDVYDGIVYLAVPQIGLEVIDVREPSSPQRVRTISDVGGARDIHIHGKLAFVGCHAAGVRILSLTEKENPKVIGRYLDDDGGEALAVWGDAHHLYVADNFGVEVLDMSDPSHPYEIGEYSRVNGAHDLFVSGPYIYVAEGRKGLIIFEFQND